MDDSLPSPLVHSSSLSALNRLKGPRKPRSYQRLRVVPPVGSSPSLPSPRSRPPTFGDWAVHSTPVYGYLLLLGTAVYFVGTMYGLTRGLVAGDQSPNQKLRSLRMRIPAEMETSTYYILLLPLLSPVAIFFIFFNWFGLKFFRHNA
ncbi:hypothetical protein BDZ88DRAFT_190465 [Geranomyces variabilis]|nr:hypothetical protein BDZ88DRAFT_190465 [Geranomyces variabilis]